MTADGFDAGRWFRIPPHNINDRLPPTDLIGLWIEANFILLQHL